MDPGVVLDESAEREAFIARVLEDGRQSLDDIRHGRVIPASTVLAESKARIALAMKRLRIG